MPNDPVVSRIEAVVTRDPVKPVAQLTPRAQEEVASASLLKQAEDVKPDAPIADPEAVKKAAAQINEFIQSNSRNLQFSVDQNRNQIVVKVVDRETGEVIRQIPAEETLAIANSLDTPKGVLIHSKA